MLNKQNLQKAKDRISYRIYEIRTKDPDSNPLFGYGDSERDYDYACRVIDFFLNIEHYILSNIAVKDRYDDYLDLFGDILKEEGIYEQKI